VAANAPDVDVLAYLAGPTTALWLRRGVTHGIVAWFVLPILITGIVLGVDRLLGRSRDRERAVPSQVLLLALVGVATHPVLDLLNTYGVRLLMPFSDRWFYGDALFIVDPWIWVLLTLGIVWSRRNARVANRGTAAVHGSGHRALAHPARWALLLLAVYIGVMTGSNLAARRMVVSALAKQGLPSPERLMVAPLPLDPLRRRVVVEIDGAYLGGTFSWLGKPRVELNDLGLRREPDFRTVAAIRGPEVRHFLSWARFPYFEVAPGGSGGAVLVGDARYTLRPQGSWASVRVQMGASPDP
jgi:inner membrane protein